MKRNVTAWGHDDNVKGLFRLNLQHFADAGEGESTEGNGNNSELTFTQADFEKRLQSETDKRVTEALNTQRAKLEEEFANRQKEAERLAKLSAEEREKETRQKEREKLDAERAAFERERLVFEVGKQLAKEGLDPNFAEFLAGESAEASAENIKAFKAAFKKAVEAGVTERLGSKPPKAGGKNEGDVANPWAKDSFNLTEQGRLKRENPELAKTLQEAARKTQ